MLKFSFKELKKDGLNGCAKDFGIDDKKRFHTIKKINESEEFANKIRNFTDEELLWIHSGTLRVLNSAINLWYELSGDDLERYNEIDTPAWPHFCKKRDYIEQLLHATCLYIADGDERAIEFVEELTGGDLHRFNGIMRSSKEGRQTRKLSNDEIALKG